MKTILSLILILITIFSARSQSYTTASFQSNTIKVDGSDNDWPENYRFSESSSKLLYNISNDKGHLYFCFKSYERSTMLKLLRYGIMIDIDTNGKKKSNFQLLYPAKKEQDPQRLAHTSKQEIMLRAKTDTSHFLLKNALNTRDSIYALENTTGISVAINFDSLGATICEIAIPLNLIQAGKQTKNWNLSIELKAPTKPADFSRMSASQVSGRNNISNPAMNSNSPGQMNPNQQGIPGQNNGTMMNNAPIEPVDDENVPNENFSEELRTIFESSFWKVKLMLATTN